MGDFNSVCNSSLDRTSTSLNYSKKPSDIIQLLQQNEYIESYRFLHPDKKAFTWKSSSDPNIQTRIDYIWFNEAHLNTLAHSNIVDADLITGSDHNISTLTLDTHLVIRNYAKAKHASNKRKKPDVYTNTTRWIKKKWVKFTEALDKLAAKHKIFNKAESIKLTADKDSNRNLITDAWSDIAKCFQRAANKTVPSIIVNEDTTVNLHNHGKIKERKI